MHISQMRTCFTLSAIFLCCFAQNASTQKIVVTYFSQAGPRGWYQAGQSNRVPGQQNRYK